MPVATFKFIVRADGTLSKYPAYAWHFGEPETKSKIQLVNQDLDTTHTLEFDRFIHQQTGRDSAPLKGLRRLRARGGDVDEIEVTPRRDSNRRYGAHLYWTSLDGKEPTDDPQIIVDDPDLQTHRFHHPGHADFEFHIDDRGVLTKTPALPWKVRVGKQITIRLVNNHDRKHVVRMVRFKHKKSGKNLDPLTGTKAWTALRNSTSSVTTHKVRHHVGRYGEYLFLTSVDGVDGTDPQIIVDPP